MVTLTVPSRWIAGTNAMIDADASLDAFAVELGAAMAERFGEGLDSLGGGPLRVVLGARFRLESERSAAFSFEVEGIARAVRDCGRWTRYEEAHDASSQG